MDPAVTDVARKLVDEAKRRHGIEKDVELARKYGVNQMQILRLKEGEVGALARLILRLLEDRENSVAA
jgi:predicted transcriptional regulator